MIHRAALVGSAVAAVVLCVGTAARADSLVQRAGDEFRVNVRTRGNQLGGLVAKAPNGEFIVLWEGRQRRPKYGVYRRRFSCDGAPLSDDTLTDSSDRGDNTDPDMSVLPSGDFVVGWTEEFFEGDLTSLDQNVVAQRVSSADVSVGDEFVLNAGTIDWQRHPDIGATEDGGFVVAWKWSPRDRFDPRSAVGARPFDPMGEPLSDDIQVTNLVTTLPTNPHVATTESGEFLVVWQELLRDGDRDGIFLKRYSRMGIQIGTELAVNHFTIHNQQEPDILVNKDGGFVVVWDSYRQEGSDDVFARRFNAAGEPLGSEFQINEHTTDRQEHPGLAALPDDGFVVTWKSEAQDGDRRGIFGRTFDRLGTPTSSEFQINTYTTGYQGGNVNREHDVAVDDDGNMVVVWNSNGQDGDGPGVFAQRFTLRLPLCGHASDPLDAASACRQITAGDALAALRAATGTQSCAPCICDVDGSGATTASDAMAVLRAALDFDVTLHCPPCNDPTSKRPKPVAAAGDASAPQPKR